MGLALFCQRLQCQWTCKDCLCACLFFAQDLAPKLQAALLPAGRWTTVNQLGVRTFTEHLLQLAKLIDQLDLLQQECRWMLNGSMFCRVEGTAPNWELSG